MSILPGLFAPSYHLGIFRRNIVRQHFGAYRGADAGGRDVVLDADRDAVQ